MMRFEDNSQDRLDEHLVSSCDYDEIYKGKDFDN